MTGGRSVSLTPRPLPQGTEPRELLDHLIKTDDTAPFWSVVRAGVGGCPLSAHFSSLFTLPSRWLRAVPVSLSSTSSSS